jgi:coenzyme F420 hydrogenase subunit beta
MSTFVEASALLPVESERYHLAWAADAETRRRGASGGAITAICRHLLTSGAVDGVAAVAADGKRPISNRAVVARSDSELARCSGSRYAPVSSCLSLGELGVDERFAFVGKPCEVEALAILTKKDEALGERVALKVAIFCAQTPSRRRTERLLRNRDIDPADLTRIDYRGEGWPGSFRAFCRDGRVHEEPYSSAWEFLASGDPSLACFLCADHTGAYADIAVGDPWGAEGDVDVGDGMSLVVTRTGRGERALAGAVKAGTLKAVSAPEPLLDSVRRREALTVRRAAARCRTYSELGVFSLSAFMTNRPEGARTIIRRRLSRRYY